MCIKLYIYGTITAYTSSIALQHIKVAREASDSKDV